MKKKWFTVPLCAVFVLSAALLASCNKPGGGNDELGLKPTENYTMPDVVANELKTDASVHDPSVFQDPKDGKYYAFGSHYAVASSTDLVNWQQEVSDDDHQSLFGAGGVRAAMPQTVKLANNQTDAWAPDVSYHNGKYYMYISFTTAMYTSTSVIARVEADNVLGPYSNEKILIESITSQESDKVRPNCIDPELFEDKDGRLWMVYGSFFGGVYIKELHNSGENWGLPKEDGLHDWGKLVWRHGFDAGVEGPFVFYNKNTGYYYMMTSEANLLEDYNMHIARSENPDGPYVDVTGKDVAAEGAGNKIAGNYKFERAGSQKGFAALGHNSVIKNAQGKYFVVYHARRVSGTSVEVGHKLYTNQLFFNEDGWPVMSPVRYAGETFGIVPEADAAQTYEVVIHSQSSEVSATVSQDYALGTDGKITKGQQEVGSWQLKDGYYITLTIDAKEYKGVIVPGWDMYAVPLKQEGRLCVSAVSNEGVALWAIEGKVS